MSAVHFQLSDICTDMRRGLCDFLMPTSHSQLSVPAYKVRYQASSVFSAECAQLQSERRQLGQRLAAQLATTAQMETELDTQRQELQQAGRSRAWTFTATPWIICAHANAFRQWRNESVFGKQKEKRPS